MDVRAPGIAAVMLFAAAANGQGPGDPRATEKVVFFSGEVVMADGSVPPPDPVLIQKVCKGTAHDETWTDSKGQFSFKVTAGGTDTSIGDSSQAAARTDELSKPIGNSTYYTNPITTALRDCYVQAVLAGFLSERVSIALKNTLEDARIGRLTLHAISPGQALTVSATTLAAPPNARRAYEKGLSAMREKRWDAAANEMTKAVTAYPKFASAWFELGRLRWDHSDFTGAAGAWKEALKSDPRYVKPYESLTALAEQQQNWVDSEKYSHDWMQLAPEDFPAAYLYNAVANAQLNHVDEAEAAVRKGLSIDKEQRLPRLRYVLGLILMQKHEYSESAEYLRAYLALAPNAKDAASVREELTKIGATATAPPN
ncbi:MAG TPA: tetratricopeptide repeat protein [Bryobacteraceae bacterium]|nr:tetratricopeptide repeat protein [Bryobacteraceae bacterium]